VAPVRSRDPTRAEEISIRPPLRIPAVAVLLSVAALFASAPRAEAITACTALQDSVDTASTGQTIPINFEYLDCSIHVTGKVLTFQGTTPDAGFKGHGSGSIVSVVGSAAGASFRDLTFRGGATASDGGAISADSVASVEILRSRFFGNSAQAGGAVSLNTSGAGPIAIRDSTFGSASPGTANHASATGGGVNIITGAGPVIVERSTFAGNAAAAGGGLYVSAQIPVVRDDTFTGNAAIQQSGGGASIFSGSSAEITRSKFIGNSVASPVASSSQRFGGGLGVFSQGTITQTGNLFRDNTLTFNRTSADSFPSGGGGEFASSAVVSRNDTFVHNSVRNLAAGGEEAEGGGLFVFGCVSVPNAPRTTVRGENLVAAANSVGAGGEGAGVYIGCGTNPVDFTLLDSTIAGNTGGSPLDGGATDTLRLINSIVSAGGKALSVKGFASKAGAFSDACGTGGHALSGAGNLCVDPRLKNAAGGDVHQTSKSPTRDRGSNARVPAGLTSDFEGGARITDAEPNGYAIVDIGADETPTGRLLISSLKLSKGTFRASGRHPGTTIAFTITGPSPVRFSVARILSQNKLRAVGSFLHTAQAGRNHFKFTGRIGHTKLSPGRYRLTVKAKNRLNNRSNSASITFVIAN
jgi:hypothetical protein